MALRNPRHPIIAQLKALMLSSPLSPLVKRIFLESKDDYMTIREQQGMAEHPPLVDYISDKYSPVLPVLAELLRFLQGFGNDLSMLEALGGLTMVDKRQLRSGALKVMGQVWHRLWQYLQHFPTRIAKTCDDRETMESRQSVAREFTETCPLCRVGLDALHSRGDPMADEEQRYLKGVMRSAKLQTITIENKFRKMRLHATSNHGAIQLASTKSSNHVLSEARSLHNTLKSINNTQQTQPAAAAATKRKPTARGMYWARQMKNQRVQRSTGEDRKKVFSAIARRWQYMSDDAKESYEQEAFRANLNRLKTQMVASERKDTEDEAEQRAKRQRLSPWEMADFRWPFAKAKLDELVADKSFVADKNELWVKGHRDVVIPDSSVFPDDQALAEVPVQCSQLYGVGWCSQHFLQEEKQKLCAHDAVFRTVWKNVTDADISDGRIMILEAESSGQLVERFALAMVYSMGNPVYQIYIWLDLVTEVTQLAVGDYVTCKLRLKKMGEHTIPSFVETRDICRMMILLEKRIRNEQHDTVEWSYQVSSFTDFAGVNSYDLSQVLYTIHASTPWAKEEKIVHTDPEVDKTLSMLRSDRQPNYRKVNRARPCRARGRGQMGMFGEASSEDGDDSADEVPLHEDIQAEDVRPPKDFAVHDNDGVRKGRVTTILNSVSESHTYAVYCNKHGCISAHQFK